MKKIKVVNPQTSSDKAIQYHETEAQNWGTLERELRSAGILSGDMQVVIKENKNELSLGEALLPEGLGSSYPTPVDFTLFLSPKQIKSGVFELSQDALVDGFESLEDYLSDMEAPFTIGVFVGQLKSFFTNAETVVLDENSDPDLVEANNLGRGAFSDPDLQEAASLGGQHADDDNDNDYDDYTD